MRKENAARYGKGIVAGMFAAGLIIMSLAGCAEVDGNTRVDETGITYSSGVWKMDVPKKVKVYEAESWQKPEEKLKNIFLKGDVVDTITVEATGVKTYLTEYEEKIEDFSASLYRGEEDAPVLFHYLVRDQEMCQLVYHNENFEHYYGVFHVTGRFPEQAEETEDYGQAVEVVQEYLEKMDYPESEIYTAAKLESEETGTGFYVLAVRQLVDEIPLASIDMPDDASTMYYEVYKEGYNRELKQYGGSMLVCVMDGEIIWWTQDLGAVLPKKEIDECRIVSAKQAYKKIQEVYEKKGAGSKPRLEQVELQYLCLEKGGRKILTPVWVFGVSEKENKSINMWTPGKHWCYYVVDAVSGEFLTDISE